MTNYLYINSPINKMVNVLITYDVFYFLDDFFGEDTNTGQLPKLKEVVEIWKGEKSYNSENAEIHKLYQSINYISTILRKDSPKTFFKKYTNSVLEHLSFSLNNYKYQTVDEYISIRLKTGGMFPVIHLIEYVHSIYLSKEVIANEALLIKALCEQCALIGALSNDIFSYAKEKHSDYNLINAYLVTNEAATYKEAVTKSIEKVNNIHTDFQLTMKKAKQKAKSLQLNDRLIVEKYFEALDVIVAASYHWQKTTNRYNHPENVFEDMKAN